MFGRKSIGHINSVGKETKEKEKDVFYSHHFLRSITLIMLRILPTSNHCSIRCFCCWFFPVEGGDPTPETKEYWLEENLGYMQIV
ncbi:hypothetical protein ACSQ67_011571 [Phaseolus vulgaris]